MAIVARSVAPVVFSILDETGNIGRFKTHVPSATTVADLTTAATDLLATLAGVTDGAIAGWAATFGAAENVVGLLVPDAGSRRERKGVLSLGTTEPGKYARLEIPAVAAAIVRPDGSIDEDSAAAAAFIADLIDGPWCDSNGNDINGLVRLYERYDRTTPRGLPSRRTPDADAVAG